MTTRLMTQLLLLIVLGHRVVTLILKLLKVCRPKIPIVRLNVLRNLKFLMQVLSLMIPALDTSFLVTRISRLLTFLKLIDFPRRLRRLISVTLIPRKLLLFLVTGRGQT